MKTRQLNTLDQIIDVFDRALRTLTPNDVTHPRSKPSQFENEDSSSNETLSEEEKRHAAGLMRVNHSGEVCAQALYQGQGLTAKLPEVREQMNEAAEEEVQHLLWCEGRLNELDSHTSILNPCWYGLSFLLGAGAGLISDKVSLGFVAATEENVGNHLREHLVSLPEQDKASRAIVEAMLEDEMKHQHNALEAGGIDFPAPVKKAMVLAAKLMTKTSYRI